MHPTLTIRYATVDDVPELVRLREVMWASMGLPMAEDGWRERCTEVVEGWLRAGEAVAAVVERPDGPGLVACGVGSVDDLHASAQGEPVYRAHGFTENHQPALRWRAP